MTSANSMLKQGTQSWCSGTIQRDRVGREVGGVSEWEGETCIPVANSYGKSHHNIVNSYPPININKLIFKINKITLKI